MTQPVEFSFDERKAAQAAARLLRHDGPMPGLQLARLLYLADRQAMCEHGYPITGDRFVCIATGPALERVFELTHRSSRQHGPVWPEYVRISDHERLSAAIGGDCGELSDYDCAVLDRICEQFGAMDAAELGKRMRALPEWSDPKGAAAPIEPRQILRQAGFDDAELADIAGQLKAERALATALGE